MSVHRGAPRRGPADRWRTPSYQEQAAQSRAASGQSRTPFQDAVEAIAAPSRRHSADDSDVPTRNTHHNKETATMNQNTDTIDTAASESAALVAAQKKARRKSIARTVGKVALGVFGIGAVALGGTLAYNKWGRA